jgi:hypothetical protein
MNRGKEDTVSIGGKNYRLAKPNVKLWNRFVEWVNQTLGNPFDDIKGLLAGLPVESQKLLIDHAQSVKMARRAVDSPEVHAQINTIPGSVEMFSLMMGEHNKNLSRDELRALAWDYLEEQGEEAVFTAIDEGHGNIYREEAEAEKIALAQMGKWEEPAQKK